MVRIPRGLKNLWAGIMIAALIPVLLFRIIGFAIGLFARRRWTRITFRRRLLHAGLSPKEADELTTRFHPPIALRQLYRYRHRHS